MLLASVFYFVNILGSHNPYNHSPDITVAELGGKVMMLRIYDGQQISVGELYYYYHHLKPGEFIGGEVSPDPEDMAVVQDFGYLVERPVHLLENTWILEKPL